MADEAPTLGKPHTNTSEALSAPHDRVGKPIAVGAEVAIFGGGRGVVKAVGNDTEIVVTRADGQDTTENAGDIVVIREAADAGAPADAAAPDGAPSLLDEGAAPPAAPAAPPTPPVDPDAAGYVPGVVATPDNASDQTPAPDADPDGAFAWLVNDDATQQAWLRVDEAPDPVGYVQTNTDDPNSVVRYADAEAWAAEVDQMGLHDAGDGASPMQPSGPGDAVAGEPPEAVAPVEPEDDVDEDLDEDPAADDEEDPDAEDDPDDEDDEDEDEDDDSNVPPQFRKKKGKSLDPGAFITFDTDGTTHVGQIELVVSAGTVPGLAGKSATGTKDKPVARVLLWQDGQPTGTKSAVALPDATALGVTHEDVLAVDSRGRNAWPGTKVTTLSDVEWAHGRVDAFLTKARGIDVPGYVGDDDLLGVTPRIRRTPEVTVSTKSVTDRGDLVTVDRAALDAVLSELDG